MFDWVLNTPLGSSVLLIIISTNGLFPTFAQENLLQMNYVKNTENNKPQSLSLREALIETVKSKPKT